MWRINVCEPNTYIAILCHCDTVLLYAKMIALHFVWGVSGEWRHVLKQQLVSNTITNFKNLVALWIVPEMLRWQNIDNMNYSIRHNRCHLLKRDLYFGRFVILIAGIDCILADTLWHGLRIAGSFGQMAASCSCYYIFLTKYCCKHF